PDLGPRVRFEGSLKQGSRKKNARKLLLGGAVRPINAAAPINQQHRCSRASAKALEHGPANILPRRIHESLPASRPPGPLIPDTWGFHPGRALHSRVARNARNYPPRPYRTIEWPRIAPSAYREKPGNDNKPLTQK